WWAERKSSIGARPYQGDMRGRLGRHPAAQARVVSDLDGELVGREAGAPIERNGGRVVERAGMHPGPADARLERTVQRPVHQPPRRAGADLGAIHPEEGQFDLAGLPPVEFGDADGFAVAFEDMDLA